MQGWIIEIYDDEVRTLSPIQASNVFLESKTLSAAQRGHPKCGLFVQSVRPPRSIPLLKHLGTHLFKHIYDVVAGDAIRAESNCDSRCCYFRNRSNTVSEFPIRFRAMNYSRAL